MTKQDLLYSTRNSAQSYMAAWIGDGGLGENGYMYGASLVAQMVKNLPAMQETLGLIPGLGRSPGGNMATHLNILAWRIPMDRGAWQATVHGATNHQT